jgi:hypothetical protein
MLAIKGKWCVKSNNISADEFDFDYTQKTLGIIGVGNVGLRLAAKAELMGIKTLQFLLRHIYIYLFLRQKRGIMKVTIYKGFTYLHCLFVIAGIMGWGEA